jgi:Protein of unknown function (DUF3592)
MNIRLPFDSWWTRSILFVIGTLLLAVAGSNLYEERRFTSEALTASGTVVRKEVRTTTSRRRATGTRTRTQHYDVEYRFAVGDKTFEGQGAISEDAWRQLREGDSIAVLYLPNDPAVNRPPGSNRWIPSAMLGAIGILLTTLGAVSAIRNFGR